MKYIVPAFLSLWAMGCEMLEPKNVLSPDQELKLLADSLYDLKKYAQAEELYQKIVQKYPWSGDRNINTYHWGRCHYELSKSGPDTAGMLESIRRFDMVNSGSIYAMYSLKYSGLAFHKIGLYDQAISAYTRCKKSFPGGDTLELNMYIYQAQRKIQP